MFLILGTILLFQQLTEAAVASFSVNNSGISGTVTINDREISINLDLSQVNKSLLPATDCFNEGALYHIHTKWTPDNDKDRIGEKDCNSTYTGGHWDPWTACSSSTGNEYCLKYSQSSNYKCVKSSSTWSNISNYTCNSTVYAIDPFSCEVGDFDGKYGRLYLTNDNTTFVTSQSSFWEVKSRDVQLKSIVFHCGDTKKRAFCAPFDTQGDTSNASLSQTSSSMTATFEELENSYIELKNDGSYNIDIDLSNIQNLTCQNISYRIYNSWTGSDSSYVGNASCAAVVGEVYDPTVSCLTGSDSQFCNNSKLCNDPSYVYNCSASNDRYYCSPSDLSGKYGNLATNQTVLKFVISGKDELMIPMNKIEQKSIVLECSDYSTKIACAKLIEISSSKSELSTTDIVLIVVFSVVGLVVVLLGAYYFLRKRDSFSNQEERTPLNAKQQL